MCRPSWKTGTLFGVVVGFFGEFVLSTLFSPILDPTQQWVLNNVCPVYFLCSNHIEFRANDVVQCETGAIDEIIRHAIDDGEIDGHRHRKDRSLAIRTRVCDNADWGTRKAIDHITKLAYNYPGCFDHGLDSSSIPQFSVNETRESSACISKIQLNSTNDFVVDNTYRNSIVFCFKQRENRSESSSAGLPLCTREELEHIGFTDKELLRAHNVSSQGSSSGGQ